MKKFIEDVKNYKIPLKSPDNSMGLYPSFAHYETRQICTERGMWAIVAMDWTKELAKWIGTRKVLEVMAGAGWLAKALSDHGVSIIATDNNSWDNCHKLAKALYQVQNYDAIEAIKIFEADILIISWPPYNSKVASDVLKAWGIGRPVIYIGEGKFGCNADNSFFELFEEDKNQPCIDLPQWPGIHDYVDIGYYKGDN